MCYFSTTVASLFIERSQKDGKNLTTLQVAKLTYIAHGWCLALYGTPLIADNVQAWEFGPVMPALRSFFKGYGLSKDDLVHTIMTGNEAAIIKRQHREVLDKVYAKYRNFSQNKLIALLHEEDTPWFAVWSGGAGDKQPISNEATQQYYKGKIDRLKFDALSIYPKVTSKKEAMRSLIRAGILLKDGTLNPIYSNN